MNKLPYFDRDWLYPIEAGGGQNFIAGIGYDSDDLPSQYMWGEFEIHGDNRNTVYLSYELSDEKEKELSLGALDKLITALTNFRAALVDAYEQNEAAK